MTEILHESGSADAIEFDLREGLVAITVNGRDLVETLRDIELPYAEREGHPDIAGSYCGLPPGDVLPPSRHFFGEVSPMYCDWDGKVPILACSSCGEEGCWPMVVRISVTEKVVSWADFEQPHRAEWEYRDLTFRFDLTEYEASLVKAARSM
ncbi:MAG: hypothetical protein JSV19_03500 [Phycisphaerales bacterium]|nr:MAG: hypothetical protein JSV19_03500 [Phycisphaerales bacterium]